ncbi:MAG: hypothetical protein AAF558_10290 [Verrucomicrobiota bacterium]
MPPLDEVKADLEAYFSAVDSQKSDTPQDLQPVISKLEAHATRPDPTWPGRLKHYMESRSYRKAYAELGGQRST